MSKIGKKKRSYCLSESHLWINWTEIIFVLLWPNTFLSPIVITENLHRIISVSRYIVWLVIWWNLLQFLHILSTRRFAADKNKLYSKMKRTSRLNLWRLLSQRFGLYEELQNLRSSVWQQYYLPNQLLFLQIIS